MSIAFRDSERSTVGLEWEVQIVDPKTLELSQKAARILVDVHYTSDCWLVKGEMHQNMLEFVSRKRVSVAECAADMEEAIDAAMPYAEELGVGLSGGGSHPFAHPSDQPVSETARYRELVERTRYWGRQMVIFGTHVHVGVEDRRKVAPIHNFLSAKIGHLLGISAASPYWDGVDTGYADNRAMMFQQLPTAGLPMHLNSWGDLERIAGGLVDVGAIREYNEIRWDIRPSPGFGTIEVRACDSATNLAEIRAIAAFVHALVETASRELDAGRPLLSLPFHFLETNKWRGARYGAHAELVESADGECAPLAKTLPDLLAWIEPAAEFLGCAEDLAAVPDLIASPAADRLRAAAGPDGDLKAVAAHALAEFNAGRPIQPDPVKPKSIEPDSNGPDPSEPKAAEPKNP